MALVLDDGVLQFWKPCGVGSANVKDPPSLTPRTITLKVFKTESVMVIPVYTNTKVYEVKGMLAWRLNIEPGVMKFTHRQGGIWRTNLDCEEVAKQVTVSGIKSFEKEKKEWEHPHCVIGAGHLGLKTAMTWVMEKCSNFVVFDRRDQVGGTSWISQANSTSRLQTEVGVYHLQFHETTGWPEDGPTNPWPSRAQLLKHFHNVAEEWGILPQCRMRTNVKRMNVIGKDYWEQVYEIETETDEGMEEVLTVSSVALYPGNLTNPKKVEYVGEEKFDGHIVYGISNNFEYSHCTDNIVSIIGSGAFAVENVRTCVEFAVKKIYMVCRRKTLALPRMVSWLINQSANFITAALSMEAMTPMYDLIDVDHWRYYAVYSNEARTNVTIRQKSRFGIGDVYYLAMYYGMCEHLVDDVKRLSQHRVHLVSGRVLEDVRVMLKLLGFNGEFDNDRLMKLKELYGWWCQKDFRRYIVAEPIGVDANNFGGTSFSPMAISTAENHVYILNYPKEWRGVMESGQMPTHTADPEIDRPAYVVEARYGALVGISLGALIPGIGERGTITNPIKRQRMWGMHPVDKFLELAKKEWDNWSRQIQEQGYDKPHPEYPYTLERMALYLQKESEMYQRGM